MPVQLQQSSFGLDSGNGIDDLHKGPPPEGDYEAANVGLGSVARIIQPPLFPPNRRFMTHPRPSGRRSTCPNSWLGSRPGFYSLISALLLTLPAAAQVAGGGFDKRFAWYGDADGDLMGHAVAGIGDVDGDGWGDIILGIPGADGPAGPSTPNWGRAEVRSGQSGALIYQYEGSAAFDKVGTGVSGVGDMDGDTIPDFAISSDVNGGEVNFLSGATGLLILTAPSPAGATRFGEHLASPGDVNADGTPDLLVAAPGSEFGGVLEVGAAFLISGADGSVIRGHGGVAEFDNFGRQICCPGDLDGDGVGEIVVTATGANPGGMDGAGSVFVYSGATGVPLFQFDGDAPYDFFGWSVASPGDLDGDAIPDLMVGSIFENWSGRGNVGVVSIYSGATGAKIRDHGGITGNELFGAAMCGIGDMNEDGVVDYAVGSDGSTYGGQVTLWSGADSSRLFIVESETWNEHFGTELMTAGDLDGDGKTEFLVGGHSTTKNDVKGGAAYLYEFNGFMTVNSDTIYASAGAAISLDMQFPMAWLYEPNLYYQLIISQSGTHYGSLYGLPNPLVQDYLFDLTINGIYPGPFVRPEGPLHPDGTARVKLLLGSDDATPYVGLSFSFSCLFYEQPTLGARIFRGFARASTIQIVL